MTNEPSPSHTELPVEPLTADAWRRVERRVFAELSAAPPVRSTKRVMPLLAAASAFALLLAGVVWLRAGSLEQRYTTSGRGQVVHVAGIEAQLEAQTLLRGAGDLWTLERGAAKFLVAPRKQRAPLTVLAGKVRVEVVGTVFRVVRRGDLVSVETIEGTVRVVQGGTSQLLAAGEHWPPAPSATRELDWQHPLPSAERPADPQQVTQGSANTPGERSAHPAKRDTTAERQRNLFEQATRLEARDADAALHAYRSLARESGPWASNALFALARAELELRMHGEAARDLRRYLDRYPNGPNATDARALLALLRGEQPGWTDAP